MKLNNDKHIINIFFAPYNNIVGVCAYGLLLCNDSVENVFFCIYS